MAAIILLVMAAFIMHSIMRTRSAVQATMFCNEKEQQNQEYLDALRETRMIGDFVLTGAAIPGQNVEMPPVEGYKLFPHQGYFKLNGGTIVVASASAEKIRGLMFSFVEALGETSSISFADHHSDRRHIVDYIAYNRESYMVEHLFDQYWRMILNSADIETSLFAAEEKVEIVLSKVKTIHIHAVETMPFVKILHDYGISEKTDMRFIYEDEHYLFNDYADSGEFFRMVKAFGYDEKRYYEKEEQ